MPSLRDALFAPAASRLAIPGIIITVQLFFLTNGALLFPGTWGSWQFVTIIYIFMVLASVLLNPKEFDSPPAGSVLKWFGIIFVGASLAFAAVFGLVGAVSGNTLLPVPLGAILPTFIYQVLVITYSEEVFFRGFMVPKTGIIPSSIAFAIFHFAAYSTFGFSPFQLIQPLVAGIIFAYIYQRTEPRMGIGAVWALHAVFNVTLLGVNVLIVLLTGGAI